MNEQNAPLTQEADANTVVIRERVYKLHFASIRRARQLGALLNIDIIRDGIDKLEYTEILVDDEKMKAVLALVLIDADVEDMLNNMTFGDFNAILMSFFLNVLRTSLSLSGELKHLVDSLNAKVTQNFDLQKGTL